MGNRKQKTDTIGGTTATETYTVNAANMLTGRTLGSTQYDYANDSNGNTTGQTVHVGGASVRSTVWDTQNRLVQCVTGSGAGQKTSTFTYGADGLRRSMNVQTGNVAATAQYSETKYILDGQNVAQEQTRQKSGSGGTWTAWATVNYFMGPQGPLARTTATAADARWYAYDGLGSVLAEVDVNGVAQGTRKYDVYGGTRSYTGTPVGRQAFVGQLGHATDDETGLIYMRARYYDNVTGRFINRDPAEDGDNWFAYCNNDPVNKVDKGGCKPIDLNLRQWLEYGSAQLILALTAVVLSTIAQGGLGRGWLIVAFIAAAEGIYLLADALTDVAKELPGGAGGQALGTFVLGTIINQIVNRAGGKGSKICDGFIPNLTTAIAAVESQLVLTELYLLFMP